MEYNCIDVGRDHVAKKNMHTSCRRSCSLQISTYIVWTLSKSVCASLDRLFYMKLFSRLPSIAIDNKIYTYYIKMLFLLVIPYRVRFTRKL